MGPEVGGCDGDDTVVVGGKALGFHQRLASAVRAGAEVRVSRPLAVEGARDCFSLVRGFMNGTVAEIDDLLRVPERPCRIRTTGLVPGIGGSCRVAVAQSGGHGSVVDGSGKAAIARAFKFPIPAGARQPGFELNVGVA